MLPGEIVTIAPSGNEEREKTKHRPAVVVYDFGATQLVVPITDAEKSTHPVHFNIPAFNSGTQVKDALATCEHAIAASPRRLSSRPGTIALTPSDMTGIRSCLLLAVGLRPSVAAPLGRPPFRRGEYVSVDFGVQPEPEVCGVRWALVVSNDTGNYFGDHYLVVPVLKTRAICPAHLADGVPAVGPALADVGRLRVVDKVRIDASVRPLAATDADVAAVDAQLHLVLT